VNADKALISSALKDWRESNEKQPPNEAQPNVNNAETELLSSISTSLKSVAASHMEENEMNMIALMPTPDRKELLEIKKQVYAAKYKQQLKEIIGNNKNQKTDKPTDSDEDDDDLNDITKQIF
jgi:hypothetical protein